MKNDQYFPSWLIITLLPLLLFKIYNTLTKGVYRGVERLDGKTTVVTGANSGIGLETAKDFASRGARVVMVCRDMKKAERVRSEIIFETNNSNITLKHVDFLSLESVRKSANEILCEESRIDVLVNNAGIGGICGLTDDGLEIIMQSNYFGPFLFTNILLGKIKQSTPSRIVTVSSVMHTFGNIDFNHIKNFNTKWDIKIYCGSKLANIYFSNELANKLIGTGVTSNSLHPGGIASDITRHDNYITKILWAFLMNTFCKNPKEGAQTQIYLSVSPEVANITGEYFSDCKIAKPCAKARDMEIAKKLWEFTEEVVKLKPSEKHY